MILKFIYTLFIGILLVLFVGFGIAAFYEAPKYPEAPVSLRYPKPITDASVNSTESAEITKLQIEQEKKEKDFRKIEEVYNRNVSVIGLISAVVYLVLSLMLLKNLLLISDGLLLGGVFTLLYSIVRGFASNDNKFQFVAVTVGLIIALILGYIKFIKNTSKNNK